MEQNETTEQGTVTVTEPTPTKQQALDAKRKAAREAKQAEKDAKKAANAAKRADGVIGTIKQFLDRASGTTRGEVLDELVKKFPERDRDGMAVTVGIQFSRLAKSTGRKIDSKKLDGRGRVYGFADVIEWPVVVVEGTPEVPAPAPVEQVVEQVETPTEAPVETPAEPHRNKGGKRRR